jgi:Skp family chaperone for outer membrane proteins
MAISSRATLAAGLSLLGVACLVGPSLGQQPDHDVRKATNAAPAPKAMGPATIGAVDVKAALEGYEKSKALMEAARSEFLQRQNELLKINNDGKQAVEMLAKLTPGQPDYKKMEARVGQIKAQLQVAQEQLQSDAAQKEADTFATLYRDIQSMTGQVAKQRGLTYVVRVDNSPVSGTEPQSVFASMSRPVIYFEPANDITNDVVYYLNVWYRKSNPSAAVTPAAGAATGTRPAAPASSTPAPAQTPPNGNK